MDFRPTHGRPVNLPTASNGRLGIRYDRDHVGRLMHKFGLRERRFVYSPVTAENTVTLQSEAVALV